MKKIFGYVLTFSLLASTSAYAWPWDDEKEQDAGKARSDRRTPALNKTGTSGYEAVMPQPDSLYPSQQMQTGIIQPTAADYMRPSYDPSGSVDYGAGNVNLPQIPATPSYSAPAYTPPQSYMGQSDNFYQPPVSKFKSLDYAPPPPAAYAPAPAQQPYYNYAPQQRSDISASQQMAENSTDADGYPLLGATPAPRPAPKSLEQDTRVHDLKEEFAASQNARRPLLNQNPDALAAASNSGAYIDIPPAPQQNYVPPAQSYAAVAPTQSLYAPQGYQYQFGGRPVTVRSSGARSSYSAPVSPIGATPVPAPEPVYSQKTMPLISQTQPYIYQPQMQAYEPAPQPILKAPQQAGVLPQASRSVTVRSKRAGGGISVSPMIVQQNVIPGGEGLVFNAELAGMNKGVVATPIDMPQQQQFASLAPESIPTPTAEVLRQPMLPPEPAPMPAPRRAPSYNAPAQSAYTPPPVRELPLIAKNIDVAESFTPVASSYDNPASGVGYAALPFTHAYQQKPANARISADLKPSRYERQRKTTRRYN